MEAQLWTYPTYDLKPSLGSVVYPRHDIRQVTLKVLNNPLFLTLKQDTASVKLHDICSNSFMKQF